MAYQEDAAGSADLAKLSEDVGRWRRTRAKLSPMPAALWSKATALAQRLGVHPVQSALGLNYEALRSRVGVDALRRGEWSRRCPQGRRGEHRGG